MIREVIATGKTVDAAIDAGCEQLGVERGDADFEIIDMPSKGFLGLTSKPARVRVFKEEPDPAAGKKPERPAPAERKPAPEKKPAPAAERPQHRERPAGERPAPAAERPQHRERPAGERPAPADEKRVYDLGGKVEAAVGYVKEVLSAMGLGQITVSHTTRDNVLSIKLEGDVSGAAIGRRGETLDALQYLAGLAANRGDGDYVRVVIDSGNYRDKRRGTLEQLARKLANTVIKTGRSTTLEPMNPYERRIIHSTIAEIKGVTSASTGEEPNRCVVISSTSPQPQRPFESRGGRGGKGGHGRPGGGRRDDRRGRGRREKPAPYQESSIREVPPAEAADQPLYGKIEL